MRRLKMVEALREALAQEMTLNDRVFLIGEDVCIGGGFAVSKGLVDRFGRDRILDTPISEIAFTGLAIGAAMRGMHPVVEYQFGDFVFSAMDQIVNEAAKLHYMSDGQVSVPLTFRLPVGANRRGAQHGQCTESIFMNVAGLRIVTPSTPSDAKGLLIASLRQSNPVLFYEHKLLYSFGGDRQETLQALNEEVPEEPYEIEFGRAKIAQEGRDLTIVANLLMLHRALLAAEELAKEGISAEVIDPRTLVPLDVETVARSVGKTGRLLIVEECQPVGGWGSEVIVSMVEKRIPGLKAARLGTAPTPLPYAPVMEDAVIPSVAAISDRARALVRRGFG